jgi:selenocysteine lyase/cysteine desulfurase
MNRFLEKLEQTLHFALQCYSNVHRGMGHNSLISTGLYERARDVLLECLGIDCSHTVIFCSPWRLECLLSQVRDSTDVKIVSSRDLGLPLGIRALIVPKGDLPKGAPLYPGGGTVKMVSSDFVSWANAPDRFEAGTPNIIGALALARFMQLSLNTGNEGPREFENQSLTVEQVLYSDGLEGLRGIDLLDRLRETVIGRDVYMPTSAGKRHYINFDNGASTPTFEVVWDTVCKTWRQTPETQRRIVSTIESAVHRFFGAPSSDYELFFASNTTEAIHIASEGFGTEAAKNPGAVVLNTMLEHNSNELIWRYAPDVTVARLPVDNEGFISLPELDSMLRAYNTEGRFGYSRIRLVCLCGASNVMGSYNDLAAVAETVHRYGAKLLVDAAQLAAHRAVHMADDDIDFLAFSAHKMYAPFGSGGLIARKGHLEFNNKQRAAIKASGEENVAGIAALGKAIDLLERIGMDTVQNEERQLTRYALERLSKVNGLKIYGISSEQNERFVNKGGVLCFELKGVPHNLLAKLIAEHGGIGVRSGCFCVNMYVKKLLGIGKVKNAFAHAGLALVPDIMEPLLIGLVRVSLGIANRESDIDQLVETLENIKAGKRNPVNGLLAHLHFGTPFVHATSTGVQIAALVDNAINEALAPVVI